MIRPEDVTVVQVSSMDQGGGAERIASDLARSLSRRGFDSHLAVGRRFGEADDSLLIDNVGARSRWARALLSIAPEPKGPNTPLTRWRRAERVTLKALAEPARTLARLRGREDFDHPATLSLLDIAGRPADILHLHNLHGSYFDLGALPALTAAVPTVATAHDMWLATGHCAYAMECGRWRSGCGSCPHLDTVPAIPRDATEANLARKRWIYEHSSIHLVGPSRWVLDTLEDSALAPAIASSTLIPNGVDLTVFHPGDRAAAREALGIPRNARVLMFTVASVANPYKDFQSIRDALPRIAERVGDDVLLLSLGRFPDGEDVGGLVRSIPYLGSAAEVALHLQASDVVTHMAHAENHPLAILEAQACGVPVVASRVGGIPETMVEGVTGELVPESDTAALADRVSALLLDDERRERFARAAADHARDHFGLDRMVEDYIALYERILSNEG